MPAVSQKQRGLIFSKRNQYGSESETPDKWKWIWENGWENRGKLPKYKKVKKKKIKKTSESLIMSYEQFTNEWFNFGGSNKEEPKKEESENLACKDCRYVGVPSKFKPFFSSTNQCPKCKSKNIIKEKDLIYIVKDEGTESDWGWDLT